MSLDATHSTITVDRSTQLKPSCGYTAMKAMGLVMSVFL